MNKEAKRFNDVLKIAKEKTLEKHTCYNCDYLDGAGDGLTDHCDKIHKIVLYIIKYGPFKTGIYHIDNETWICKNKKRG